MSAAQGEGSKGGVSRPVPVMQETLIRYFHLQTPGQPSGISYSKNGIHVTANKDCDLIEEALCPITAAVTGIKVRVLNQPMIPFNSTTVDYYKTVQKFDLAYPVPTNWVFEWLSCLPSLKFVRFGGGFFDICKDKEEPLRKIETSPTVQQLVINFDMVKFKKQEKIIQHQIKNKLDNLLTMVPKYLTGLNSLDLTLPEGPTLDIFLGSVPLLKRKGEKKENFSDQVYTFRTTVDSAVGPSSVHSNGQARKRNGSPPKAKMTKPSNGSRPPPGDDRAGPSRSPVKKIRIKTERPQAEVVDISGDDPDPVPADVQAHTPPQLAANDHQFNANPKVKRNGQSSPSLLGDH